MKESTVYCMESTDVLYIVMESTVYCMESTVYCMESTVYCMESTATVYWVYIWSLSREKMTKNMYLNLEVAHDPK